MHKNFAIIVSNGILVKNHRDKIGIAIWEFLWLLDRVTKIDEKGDGIVLGGKPVKLKEIADSLGLHKITIRTNLRRLIDGKYISVKRTPYGSSIKVHKAKKRVSEITNSENRELANPIPQSKRFLYPRVSENTNSKEDSSVDSSVDKDNKEAFSEKNLSLIGNPKEEIMYKQQSEHIEDLPVFDLDEAEYKNQKKPNENENWKKFVSYWKKQCLILKRIDPEISPSKDKPIFHGVKKKFENKDIISIIDFFLVSKKSDDHLTISACFSADTLNQWKKSNK